LEAGKGDRKEGVRCVLLRVDDDDEYWDGMVLLGDSSDMMDA